LSSTLTTVTQVTVSKKPRFGPKVASQAWWIDRIRDKEGPKYLTYWTHFTDYQIGQFKTLAEYDYFVLGEGIETEGAPDFGLELDYPVKLVGKPFWVNWSTLEFQDFKLWTWIQGSIALERPLGEKTVSWYNYFSIEKNQVQAKELLAPFRKESQKEFDTLLEQEYEWAYPNTSSISTIEFDLPRGSIYKNLYINRTIQDSRYIPHTEGGLVIRKRFLKYYLEQRLEEYLALGGLQELIERKTLFIEGYKLPDPFYWDLWGNLEHLRNTYADYCADEHFDPDGSEEEESVASFDTQT
jgi:hypothetical protein